MTKEMVIRYFEERSEDFGIVCETKGEIATLCKFLDDNGIREFEEEYYCDNINYYNNILLKGKIIFAADRYMFPYPSMLASGYGAWPFKDIFGGEYEVDLL